MSVVTTPDAAAVRDLGTVLGDAAERWQPGSGSGDARYDAQLFRDNATRLIVTLDLADPFLRGERPRVVECGAGPLYTVDALRWRYGDRLDLRAIEHPQAMAPALEEQLLARGVTFATHDLLAGELPWPGTDFDLVVLAEVIEHLPPTELPDLLRRLAARLSSSGALLLSSPNSQAFWNILSLAVGNGQMQQLALPPEPGAYYGHIRMYARAEVEELLSYAGLRVGEWTLVNWMHAHPWPGAPLRDRVRLGAQRIVPRLIPQWASGWVCTAVRV